MSERSIKMMNAIAKILSTGKKIDNKHGLDIEEVEPDEVEAGKGGEVYLPGKAKSGKKLEIEPATDSEMEMEEEMMKPAQLGKKKLMKR